jgi:FixJ family two-component response regulator
MTKPKITVVLIIDDEDRKKDLTKQLSAHYRVYSYFTAREYFLDPSGPVDAIVIATYRLIGVAGEHLVTELHRLKPNTKLILLTGAADIPAVICAKPYDFATLPLKFDVLVSQINDAHYENEYKPSELHASFKRFTERETDILKLVVQGCSSRDIADQLEISTKTVEAHRARIMAKTRAVDMAELVRMYRAYTNLPK